MNERDEYSATYPEFGGIRVSVMKVGQFRTITTNELIDSWDFEIYSEKELIGAGPYARPTDRNMTHAQVATDVARLYSEGVGTMHTLQGLKPGETKD